MIASRITPALFPISALDRPGCQLCMTLAGISRPGRTFECAKCERTETVIAEAPMKSEKADWLARAWTYSRVSNREWVRA